MSENDPEGGEQSFLSHLIELRERLLKAVAAVLVILLALVPVANKLYGWLAAPLIKHLPQGGTMIATEIASPMDAFYTYEARYAPGRSKHACPAPLGDALTKRVHEIAVLAHRALGCRDLSRVDFIVTQDDVVLLEVNTLPGMTATSLYPEAAAAAGLDFPALCDALVQNAHHRGRSARNSPLPLPA